LRLYHRTKSNIIGCFATLVITIILWGCASPTASQSPLSIIIQADGINTPISVEKGSTVQQALQDAGVKLGDGDKAIPSINSSLSSDTLVKVIRVKDDYYTEQVIIPFEYQELKNEALPEGERRLSQPGENGLEEITFHRVYEDGVEVSNSQVKSTIIKEAVPEIVMVGSRAAFAPVEIPGKIAYLSAGNAWLMETNTGNRNCIVCSGDLDGRIFSLSPNGRFLLFSRSSSQTDTINTLWVAVLSYDPARLINLGVENIVHYAEFSPDSTAIAYSTAEWREAAPGWQANNDLIKLAISRAGSLGEPEILLEPNSGGVYGWWGASFAWHQEENQFAYTRPDGIGLVDPQEGTQTELHSITPYQSGGYWAWVPGISWSPEGSIIYAVDHITVNSTGGAEYQEFDLLGLPASGGSPISLVKNVGMFAYPAVSPLTDAANLPIEISSENSGNRTFSVAYLQAIFPEQSEISGYRLFVIDRDGSNPRSLFPGEGEAGLKPQQVVWSPATLSLDGKFGIAVVYNGNIWIINTSAGITQQITSDGLVSRIDWR
jgi:hypothetical protein